MFLKLAENLYPGGFRGEKSHGVNFFQFKGEEILKTRF